jgi:hypothetical protein
MQQFIHQFKFKLVLLGIIFFSVFRMLNAGDLVEISRTKIFFGPGKTEVGIEKGGNEHWKPLFFSVDEKGIIHIPDFYKNRIILFDKKGALLESIPVKEGLSPRMNFFTLSPNGHYVTFSDSTLYLLGKNGLLSWKRFLGYGSTPETLYANKVAVFLALPGDDERCVIFDYASDRPLGRYGFMDGKKGIPMIRSENKTDFALTLSRMTTIPNSTIPPGSFAAKEDANLIRVDTANKSLWKKQHNKSETLYFFSEKGKLLNQGDIAYPESSTDGNGFWTFADENLNIYKNYFYDDYMLIVGYRRE